MGVFWLCFCPKGRSKIPSKLYLTSETVCFNYAYLATKQEFLHLINRKLCLTRVLESTWVKNEAFENKFERKIVRLRFHSLWRVVLEVQRLTKRLYRLWSLWKQIWAQKLWGCAFTAFEEVSGWSKGWPNDVKAWNTSNSVSLNCESKEAWRLELVEEIWKER